MLSKEYRICMPITVEEYHIGQLYMIAKHSFEQSDNGEGVAVIKNEPCEHETHGKGQYTEKRIYLSSRLPSWIAAIVPNIFYVTEKAWNYYPHTITEYTCSFVPKFSVSIETKYEDNNGTSDNCLNLDEESLERREVEFVDIAYDEYPEKYYKPQEDPTKFVSQKSGRGPLQPNWRDTCKPVMCSYKYTTVRFDVWGLQGRVESYCHKAIRDVLLVGHRQAFTWMDEWHGMTMSDLREYERGMNEETNKKLGIDNFSKDPSGSSLPSTPTNTPTDKRAPVAFPSPHLPAKHTTPPPQ